jgi:sortase A
MGCETIGAGGTLGGGPGRSLPGVLVGVLGIAGRALVALGAVVLAFTAYQLWGTGILESHAQATLRSRLAGELPAGAAAEARREAAGPAVPSGGGTGPPRTAPPVAPPADGSPVGILQIPSIGLDQVVVEGVQAAQLRSGPGHYPGTPLPGEAGNVAIAGHRTTYAHPFYDLNAVAPGDRIVITTPQGVFVYAAGTSTVVSPTDVSVIGPSPGATLTLTTCNPRYSASSRLVLRATLARSRLFPAGERGGSAGRRTAAPPVGAGRSARGHEGGLAGTSGGSDWLPAALWGVGLVAVAIGIRAAGRRTRRRWTVYLPGAVVLGALLLAFFVAVSPLLPASL